MRIDAKKTGGGTGILPESFHAEAEVTIMLQAFENELDALLKLIDTERNKSVSEAIYRRYITADEIHQSVKERLNRVNLKMDMVAERVIGGFGGGRVLESAREPDQATP